MFLGGFQIERQDQVLNIDYIKEMDLIGGRWIEYGKMITLNMLKRKKYLLGFGLGRSNQGIREFPELKEKIGYLFGLGYAYTPVDVAEYIQEERKRPSFAAKETIRLSTSALSQDPEWLLRKGGGRGAIPTLFRTLVDKNNGRHPGFEIFEDVALVDTMEKQLMLSTKKKEKETAPAQSDWTSLSEDNALCLLDDGYLG